MTPEIHEIVLNSMSEQVYVRDLEKNLIFINTSAEKLTGCSSTEATDKKCYELFGDEGNTCLNNCPVDRAIRQKAPILHHEGTLRNKYGKIRKMRVSITPISNTYPSGAVVVMQDINDLEKMEKTHVKTLIKLEKEMALRKEMEDELKRKEQFLENVFDSIQDGINVLDTEMNILSANRTMQQLYSHEMPLIGKKCFQVFQNREILCPSCPVMKSFKSGVLEMQRVPFKRPDLPDGVMELYAFPMFDNYGKPTGAVKYLRDITMKDQTERLIRVQRDLGLRLAKSSTFQQVVDAALEALIQIDEVNCAGIYEILPDKGGLRLAGYKNLPNWFVDECLYYAPDTQQVQLIMKGRPIFSTYGQFLSNLHLSDEEIVKKKASGMKAFAMMPIINRDKVIGGMNVASHTSPMFQEFTKYSMESIAMQVGEASERIKDQTLRQELVKKSLQEKEILLREIHHRVKNNMQVISSLIHLQLRNIDDVKTVAAFQETENRVHAMSLVHEILYQSETLSKIDFQAYLEKLVRHLSEMYIENVEITINAGEIVLPMEEAVTCGLIATELISNSLKHAFPNDMKGKLAIEVNMKKNRYSMRISDNGVGFPRKIDWKQSNTLGLRLVRELVRGQLEGDLQLIETEGSLWLIEWEREA
ncbi:hypothetical protein MTBBW1_790022 [Desulfamplus magnetovallimortis]|uniref:histidine kinase n=1 Tax=Desulfamplus magnetovallimortis TaxID=1246637 RepID=A0A1W1HJI1_9BACT|nr:histidine kinase dimerization/phosphoacceptor domain -containing protein [Desulfamplus magnetovallimortis]SLM32624.1 hypothetical protein MTBBW1_790022 [Desulfamplus magnetovallimortis]